MLPQQKDALRVVLTMVFAMKKLESVNAMLVLLGLHAVSVTTLCAQTIAQTLNTGCASSLMRIDFSVCAKKDGVAMTALLMLAAQKV